MESLMNKNARMALKELADQNGWTCGLEIITATGPPHKRCYTAVASVGEQSFTPASAFSKKDAKEYAADLALRALQGSNGIDLGYGPLTVEKRKPSAANKDPVSLLNEYAQKHKVMIEFEEIPSDTPWMFAAQVTVEEETYSPGTGVTKKEAKKNAAKNALKELGMIAIADTEQDKNNYSNLDCNSSNSSSSYSSGYDTGENLAQNNYPSHRNPVSILNECGQRKRVQVQFEEMGCSGPDHCKVFSVRAIVGNQSFEPGTGSSKKEARKNAAISALAQMGYGDVTKEENPNVGSDNGALTKDPVSVINEYGQKQHAKVAFEELGYTGPDHSRTFTICVVVGERKFEAATGQNKKEAKKNAALQALKELFNWTIENGSSEKSDSVGLPEQDSSEDTPMNGTPHKNPISALYEFCQAHKLPAPEAVDEVPAAGRSPLLYYICYEVGDNKYSIGEGHTKKIAKLRAAKACLRDLRKQAENVKYIPTNGSAADHYAALGWNRFIQLSAFAPEDWRFAGYKVLASFIMCKNEEDRGSVVSLGTGNRCIEGDKLKLDGTTLNDSHAEIIARRGLQRYFYHQLDEFYNGDKDESIFIQNDGRARLSLKEGVKFQLYISTAPCGDAATFINDRSTPTNSDSCESHQPLFSSKQKQGLLRTKIERGEGTIPLDNDCGVQTVDGVLRGQRLRTASCSDKIARWNVLGLQGAVLSNLIEPIYLNSIALGNLFDSGHLARAVCCRVERQGESTLSSTLPKLYCVNHPILALGRLKAQDPMRDIELKTRTKNLCLNWAQGDEENVEVTDGCQGLTLTNKPSRLSKATLFESFKSIVSVNPEYEGRTYCEAKNMDTDFQKAKKSFFQHMEQRGYGSWSLVKKPQELEMFT